MSTKLAINITERVNIRGGGKYAPFWRYVQTRFSKEALRTKHLVGEERDKFLKELVKRRDALKKAEKALERCKEKIKKANPIDVSARAALIKERSRLYYQVKRVREPYIEYQNKSIELNFRFILKNAARYSGSVPPHKFDDLIQECVMGWQRGLRTYDPAKGQLTTHGSFWIMQGVRRFIYLDHVVHVPIYQYERGVRLDPAYSLDAPKLAHTTYDPNGANLQSFADFLVDDEAPDPDENVHQMERAGLARSLLYTLDDRERDIVMRRFGMNGYGPDGETLDAIGKEYGLTRERVRQIEKKALDKIRDGVKRGSIKPTARPVFTVIQGGGE